MHLPAPLPADPATQQPTPQPVDVNNQILLRLLHSRYRMRLQSQLLSEKRFDEHLDPLPFDGYNNSPQKIRCFEDSRPPLHRQPAASKILQLQLHFLERSPMAKLRCTSISTPQIVPERGSDEALLIAAGLVTLARNRFDPFA